MLLQRPKPFEDESLESYLIRIANRNGYQDVDRFLSALKHYLCVERSRSAAETNKH
ncbi:TniQ family protein, partial [Vibrio fluvialis]|nr:TniQ family protein [Vibrio fluvialis]MCG6377483.1 TniQ family protein [Vibrio fluvialis]